MADDWAATSDVPLLTPWERITELAYHLRLACDVIQLLLREEGCRRCPNCGYRLKPETERRQNGNSHAL